jgi:hypothetical protein
MRRAVIAVLAVALSTVSVPAVADSPQELASGRVLDAAGAAVSGASVSVLLWPTQDVAVGQSVAQPLLGSSVTDADGYFVVVAQDVAPMLSDAAKNGGYANLELRVQNDSLLFETFFTFQVAAAQWIPLRPSRSSGLAPSTGPRALTITLAPGRPGVSTIAPRVVAPAGVEPTPPCLTWVKQTELPEAWGNVGEIHRWGTAILKDTFSYGATADSIFEIAFSTGTGSWYVNGTYAIGNSSASGTAAMTAVTSADAATGYMVQAKFKRAEYAQVCTNNKKRQAYAWNGLDIRKGASLTGFDGHCGDTYAQYAHTFTPDQTVWTRSDNQAQWWSQGIDLGVLMAGGRSGYSTFVQSTWSFKSGVNKTLCGNDADIGSAHRVFAGL